MTPYFFSAITETRNLSAVQNKSYAFVGVFFIVHHTQRKTYHQHPDYFLFSFRQQIPLGLKQYICIISKGLEKIV